MGDLNIGISNERKDNNFPSDLCDTFSPQNKIIEKTCRKSYVGTSIEVMLTKIDQEVFIRLAYLKQELANIKN